MVWKASSTGDSIDSMRAWRPAQMPTGIAISAAITTLIDTCTNVSLEGSHNPVNPIMNTETAPNRASRQPRTAYPRIAASSTHTGQRMVVPTQFFSGT